MSTHRLMAAHTPASDFVCGDAKLALSGLLSRIDGRLSVAPSFQKEFRDLKAAATSEYLGTLGVYGSFPAQLRNALPDDAIWARDVTQNNTTWGNRVFPLYDPRQNIYPVGAGIGQGLSLAIGAAAAANGRKTVCMTGDGGFFLNVGELWTAVQEKLDLAVIVMNDRGYGVIKRIQDATQQGRRFFADLQGPPLEGLAQLADIPFFRVENAAELGNTVARALSANGPSLIEVDMQKVGEFPAYFPFNRR